MARRFQIAVFAFCMIALIAVGGGCASGPWSRSADEEHSRENKRTKSKNIGFFDGSIMERELFGDEE